MQLSHLLYISDAAQSMDADELEAIRCVSARNNAKLGVTGVLFYSACHFVQLLEGDTRVIHRLFEKIANDPRHRNVRLLVLRPAEKRVFSDWAMGLLDLTECDPQRVRDLEELVKLAGEGDDQTCGTPVELEILSKFCMLLPAA